VLDTIKIPSEKKEYLVPFFQRIKEQYGEPKALIHDMARGIIAAVEEVFPGIPDFICHFHFLRDLGKDLLLDDYVKLQKRLRKIKVRPSLRLKAKYLEQKIDPDCQSINEIMVSFESGTWQTTSFRNIPWITAVALIQWVFEYPRQSNGYGFPFDRPHLDFYRRLQSAHRLLREIKNVYLRGNIKDNRPFYRFQHPLITGTIAIIAIVREVLLHFFGYALVHYPGEPQKFPWVVDFHAAKNCGSQHLFLLCPLYDYQASLIVVIAFWIYAWSANNYGKKTSGFIPYQCRQLHIKEKIQVSDRINSDTYHGKRRILQGSLNSFQA
jgi:hypothetical protein